MTNYIVIPVDREGTPAAAGMVAELSAALPQGQNKIVVVCDGGRDQVEQSLKSADAAGPDLIVCGTDIPLGMGASLLHGILAVLADSAQPQEDTLVTYEPGLARERGLLADLVKGLANGADIVIASRHQLGGGYQNFSVPRKLFSVQVNRLMGRRFPGKAVRDYTIFLRAYRVSLIKQAVVYFGPYGLVQARGFVANTELLIKLMFFTDRIAEFGWRYDLKTNKSREKIKIFDTINEYLVIGDYLRRLEHKLRVRGMLLNSLPQRSA